MDALGALGHFLFIALVTLPLPTACLAIVALIVYRRHCREESEARALYLARHWAEPL